MNKSAPVKIIIQDGHETIELDEKNMIDGKEYPVRYAEIDYMLVKNGHKISMFEVIEK